MGESEKKRTKKYKIVSKSSKLYGENVIYKKGNLISLYSYSHKYIESAEKKVSAFWLFWLSGFLQCI